MESTSQAVPQTSGNAKSRIAYSFGAFGHDIFYATLSTFFITFVTSHLFNTGNEAQMTGWFYTLPTLSRPYELSN